MHNAEKISRFLIDLSSGREFADPESVVSHDGLLQRIVASRFARVANSRQVFNRLHLKLIGLAEHSFSLRDINTLEGVSRVLVNLQIAKAKHTGRYYQGIALGRIGRTDEALSLLEAVAENAPDLYRGRSLQTLGSIYHRQGRRDEALRFYSEALRMASRNDARDLLTTLLGHLAISCIKSEMGDHRRALADYESLSPLVEIISRQNPLYFYFYHNDLAVEFSELGRITEAKAACTIALASPFASAYPEWSETRDEIAAKRTAATTSVVAISRAPEADRAVQAEPTPQAEARRQRKPSKPFTTVAWLASTTDSLQRPFVPIPATATITLNAISILDRALICIGPRAPPALC